MTRVDHAVPSAHAMLTRALSVIDAVIEDHRIDLQDREIGIVTALDQGVARVTGLPGVRSEELLEFRDGRLAMALDLGVDEIGVVLLDRSEGIEAGDEVRRTGRVLDVGVGDALLGRVVDPMGRALDRRGPIRSVRRLPVERPAPSIMDRDPVEVPLQTGIKVIDALVPIGRGQRELILGDRQTGKSAIAVDTILNQRGEDMVCVYCAIGLRSAAVARVIDDLRRRGAMEYTTVVATTGEDSAGLKFVGPYAATSIAEHFMEEGRDVLVVYDDLTHHARAYREISLLLRRPPGREAFPGDIFYIHSRLLERATHLVERLGGGSMTALPIIETEAQNVAAYIPTNLISITDGQVYVSPALFRQGQLPAVDVGLSVSRVGGRAQLPAYRAVVGDLRLAYAQFEELERFARYGARLEPHLQAQLDRGHRVREILKQPQYEAMEVGRQVAVLVALNEGVFDDVPLDDVSGAEHAVTCAVADELADILTRVESGASLEKDDVRAIERVATETIAARYRTDSYGDA
jgi:F-type H+/Na+-transporting ATPase subunit alpha